MERVRLPDCTRYKDGACAAVFAGATPHPGPTELWCSCLWRWWRQATRLLQRASVDVKKAAASASGMGLYNAGPGNNKLVQDTLVTLERLAACEQSCVACRVQWLSACARGASTDRLQHPVTLCRGHSYVKFAFLNPRLARRDREAAAHQLAKVQV